MKRKMIEAECQWCGKDFAHRKDHPNKYCSRKCAGYARRHQVICKVCGCRVKKSRNKYCSMKCVIKERTKNTIFTLLCDECGVLFSRHKSHIHKVNNFCSNECYGVWQSKHRSGKNHPRSKPIWTEEKRTDSNGRGRMWVKIAYPNIWVSRAKYLLEQQGFPVSEGKIVHHKDKDTLNDSLTNLLIVTRKWHINCHRKELNEGRKP